MATRTITADVRPSPFLSLGFRPFYLLASLFAIIAMILWILAIAGRIGGPDGIGLVELHAHEFMFGFAPAVLAGFILTAARSWSGLPTASGMGLGALAVLWIAGRVGMAFSAGPSAMLIDALFLPALAVVVAIPIIRSGKLTHMRVVTLVFLLALVNIVFHLEQQGVIAVDRLVPIIAGIGIWTLMLTLVGGRVVPAFTDNARGAPLARRTATLEVAVFVATAAAFFASTAGWERVSAPLFLLAALLHLVRLVLWHPLRGLNEPLLWVLPLAYAWIPVGLALMGLAALGIVPPVAAIHALTIGAITSMMLAIMTRSTLGHTGRPLKAYGTEAVIYLSITAAAATRVCASVAQDGALLTTIAGFAWILAFSLFALRYGPMLIAERADGKPANA